LIEVSCIRISSFPKAREGPPSGGRNTYKLFLFPLGHGKMKKKRTFTVRRYGDE
jgi:hypothetical protein